MKKVVLGILIAIFVEVAVGLFVVRSGAYNVSAVERHTAIVRWVLSSAMDNSVRRHSVGIQAPVQFDATSIQIGFHHYKEMCESCHGGPGVSKSEIGKGLNPPAPNLGRAAGDWSDAELFWIIKNGIKMSGMPSFGPTHDEKQLWAVVAFTRRLQSMTPDEYRSMGISTMIEGDNDSQNREGNAK